MKIHDEIEEWLAAAECDALTPEEQTQFAQHLAACPRCRALHTETQHMSTILENTFTPQRPDPQFEQRVVRSFRERAGRRGWFGRFAQQILWLSRLRPTQAVVAIFLLMALVKSGSLLTGEQSPTMHARQEFDGRFSYDALGRRKTNGPSRTVIPDLGAAGEGGLITNGKDQAEVRREMVKDGWDKPSEEKAASLSNFKASAPASAPTPYADAYLENSNFDELKKAESSRSLREMAKNKMDANGSFANAQKSADTRQLAQQSASDGVEPMLQSQVAAPAAPAPQSAPPADSRKLIRNASLELEVATFQPAVDAITRLAGEQQGYVATQNSARGANGKLQGTLVVKVRPATLDALLLQLRALGDVKNQAVGTQDVTKDYFDTDARMRNAQIMEARLIEMLKTTKGKVSELLQVEKELARVRGEIEQMQGELKVYDSLIAYATVTLTLREKDLDQAAAYLLKENASLELCSAEVEKTFAAARHEAEEAKAQILQSRLQRDENGRTTATLSLLLAPETADGTILRIKALGRVQSYNVRDERVARDGAANSDTAKIERDKVTLEMTIKPDDDARQRTNITVITPQVETAFEKAKADASALGAAIMQSSLTRDPQGRSAGQLVVRVPAAGYESALAIFQKAGRVGTLSIERNDRAGVPEGPVLLALSLTSEEAPVQQTNLRVLSERVEAQAAAIKQAAAGAGAEVKDSSFQRESGGVEVASLVFRLPMKNYPAFVEQIKALGKVKDFTVSRNDSAAKADGSASADHENAPAQISLSIFSQGDLLADDSGVLATIRHTLSQGFAALLWSVRMIGVALAFVAPWAIALGAVIAGVWRLRRGRR